jgi:flagellar biosynthesis/type III secretory pathway protein FliH
MKNKNYEAGYKAGFKAGYNQAQDEMREQVRDFLRTETARMQEQTAEFHKIIAARNLLEKPAKGSC